jgi:RNA polymerase sigma-70 factor (ECF subfamily)
MYVKAYAVLSDHGLAEDAVSEAFIRVYRNLHRITDVDGGQTAAFLVTIVKNVAIDLYHKRNKVIVADFGEHEQASDFDLESEIETKDEAASVLRLVDKLGEDLKAVFLLKFAHDLPHKDIAKILNLTENNVTVKLHRAKKKLLAWKEGGKI